MQIRWATRRADLRVTTAIHISRQTNKFGYRISDAMMPDHSEAEQQLLVLDADPADGLERNALLVQALHDDADGFRRARIEGLAAVAGEDGALRRHRLDGFNQALQRQAVECRQQVDGTEFHV